MHSKIVHLDLSKNLLGDKGVALLCPAIAKSLSLVSLRLGSNEITSLGIAKLFTALSKNESLAEIDIGTEDGIQRNRMCPKSFKTLYEVLLKNRSCVVYRLKAVSMGTQGLESILDALIKTHDDYKEAVRKAQAYQVQENEFLASELEKKLQNNDALIVLGKLKKRHPIMTKKPQIEFVKAAV